MPGEAQGDADSSEESTRQPPSTQRSHSRKALVIALFGVVVVVLAAAIATIVESAHHAPSGQGSSPSASPHRSPSPAQCTLKVLHIGFAVGLHKAIYYGMMIKNPCPRASVGTNILVEPVDKSGHELVGLGDGPDVSVIMPNTVVSVAGIIENNPDQTSPDHFRADSIARLRVRFDPLRLYPVSELPDKTEITTHYESLSSYQDRLATLKFSVTTHPPLGAFDYVFVHAVFRDRTGRILSGDAGPFNYHPDRKYQSTIVWVPPHADPSRTTVSVFQG
jgi:hypothetical protein